MSVIGSNILAGASGQGGAYTIEESLRFNASQSSYLSWTPASAGNRKTWTWSGWFKKGVITNTGCLFGAGTTTNSGNGVTEISFQADNTMALTVWQFISGVQWRVTTSAIQRDPSAWYHFVITIDTTQATSSNRVKIYINGVQQTSLFYAVYPSQNYDTGVNATNAHGIGRRPDGSNLLDGYITEVNFIDGQALDPSSFGEFDSVTGVWKPAKYTGTYGTNGFYLPMQLDNTVEGFNTVTYIGTQKPQKISGVGFSPDLVWIKSRNNAQNHTLYDSVRGATKYLMSNSTNAEATDAQTLTSFDTDGFSMGTSFPNDLNYTYVAWCWDAGSSTVSNTDGSITSSVRSNPAYGFSIVSYTGTGANATVGHGLGTAPSMIIVKNRSAGGSWMVYHTSIGNTGAVFLNITNATITSSTYFNNTTPTSDVFSIGDATACNGSGNSIVAYCFSEVAGYSKFGSYTGTGASGNTVTTGFKPAFVMIKRTDTTSNWVVLDNTRRSINPNGLQLYPNLSAAEDNYTTILPTDLTNTGFTLNHNTSNTNESGGTYIYMAFKDTREYAYWLDDSGNNNDWQPNGGITTESTVTDTPTPYADGGNYATLNPLDSKYTPTEANLSVVCGTAVPRSAVGSMFPASGKWYTEVYCSSNGGGANRFIIGFTTQANSQTYPVSVTDGVVYSAAAGDLYVDGSLTSYGATYGQGDTIGIALNLDDNEITFYKNNTSQGTYTGKTFEGDGYGLVMGHGSSTLASTYKVNFGQRPFAYTPPTGFKPLHTGNLPDSAIVDGSEYFNAVTYTGNGYPTSGTQSISTVNFQPDFVWIKDRSRGGYNHFLQDVLRGSTNVLRSNTTGVANTESTAVTSFNADGFSLGASNEVNYQNDAFISWNWKANGAGVSNTDGSITSTVSANPTAGFSIVTYTGNGISGATVGHGLGAAPDIYIIKNRSTTAQWSVKYTIVDGSLDYMFLESTAAADNAGETAPTSSVINVWNGTEEGASGNNYVAYCFAEVEGYSKFGSYTGNGSADGPFVYLGFRPAFVMVKRTDAADEWAISDGKRNPYNVNNLALFANRSNAESGSQNIADFTSNGFKIRGAPSWSNTSGGTYIYMAFAENPFKNSLAR